MEHLEVVLVGGLPVRPLFKVNNIGFWGRAAGRKRGGGRPCAGGWGEAGVVGDAASRHRFWCLHEPLSRVDTMASDVVGMWIVIDTVVVMMQ